MKEDNSMTYPYTFTDGIFQVLRLLILGGIYKLTSSMLTSTFTGSGVMIIMLSFFLYYLVNQAFNSMMWSIFQCEALSGHDYSFLLEENNNHANIMGAGVFEKFEFETMKKYLLEKAQHIHRCKSKLVNKYGLYWY